MLAVELRCYESDWSLAILTIWHLDQDSPNVDSILY